VISIDAVVLQASSINLSDRAGLTAELTIRVAEIIPYFIEAALSFRFNGNFIIPRIGSVFD